MNRQRGFGDLLVLYVIGAIAAALVIGGGIYKAQHWCNVACQDARKERDTLAAEKAAVLKREAAIAVLYGEQVARTSKVESQLTEARNVRFGSARANVRALSPADRDRAVPAAVVRVLDDAARAANASGPAAGTQASVAPPADRAGRDARLGAVAEWMVTVAEIHAECRDRVAQWERFYDGLRAAQGAPDG